MRPFPTSPFSTPLSGSAREAERRLRSLFQGPKKRPPILALALASVLALSCGGLVSCQSLPEEGDISYPPGFYDLLGEPLTVTVPAGTYVSESPGEPPLEGLTAADLPDTPVNLEDFSQSESWNETVWLLSQDSQRDIALYGVIQFENYEPSLTSSEGLYGIIVRSGTQWAFYPLDWSVNLRDYQAPELWLGDYDGDGQEELAFSLAFGQGSQIWQETLYLLELDSLEYQVPDLSTAGAHLSASYDPEHLTLYAATSNQLLMLDEAWVEGAPILDGSLQGGTRVEFSLQNGALWCTMALIPSEAPLSNPVVVDYPVVFQDDAYVLGSPELSADSLPPSEQYAPSSDLLLWIAEDGQVMQAATQEEYAAGGVPYVTEDGHIFYRF